MSKFLKHCPDTRLVTLFRSSRRFASFFRSKDHLSPLLCSNVIYKYTCSSCNASYYGKTSRNLKIRCLERLGISKSGRRMSSPSNSSIYDHISSLGRNGSVEDSEIISRNSNLLDLLFYESLLIIKDRPSLNSRRSTIPLILF